MEVILSRGESNALFVGFLGLGYWGGWWVIGKLKGRHSGVGRNPF